MTRHIFAFILFVVLISVFPKTSLAITSPLSVPNNKIGVHILDPHELEEAAKLVNSSQGKWGYVTVPMASNDRDRLKWTAFFKRANELNIIPIVRLATFVDGDKWVAPTAYDLVDFANFLDQMPWPTDNRYIILFNEPNHANEWGGKVNPGEYAALLVQANQIFKPRSQKYFLLTAGLDMSAPTNQTSLDALKYYQQMSKIVPNWGNFVDGFSFHAYPNPAFKAPYHSKTRFGPTSYRYEIATLKSLGINPKYYFITETGTLNTNGFYKNAITQVWTEPEIVAITPFLLFAGAGNFTGFSLLDLQRKPTSNYQEIFELPKVAGSPLLNIEIISKLNLNPKIESPVTAASPKIIDSLVSKIKNIFKKTLPQLTIGSTTLEVEIADTDPARIKGLSGRKSLPNLTGMLFIFPDSSLRSFWMNEMLFDLDIIWINDGQVVELSQKIPSPKNNNGTTFKINSSFPAQWVLEVPAGFIATHNIKVGDKVDLKNYAHNSWR